MNLEPSLPLDHSYRYLSPAPKPSGNLPVPDNAFLKCSAFPLKFIEVSLTKRNQKVNASALLQEFFAMIMKTQAKSAGGGKSAAAPPQRPALSRRIWQA
jgi:hypothetical protein